MRKILPLIVVILLAGGGIHRYIWSKQAAIVEHNVRETVDALNKQLAPISGNTQVVSYENLRVEGWPFSIRIVLTKPAFNIPVSAFLNWRNSKIGKTAPVTFNWVERLEMPDGEMAIVSNLSGSSFSVHMSKNQKMTTLVDGKVENTRTATYEGDASCSVDLHKGVAGNPAPQNPSDFFPNIQKVGCDFPNVSVTGEEGKTLYSTVGALNIALSSSTPSAGFVRVDFTASLRNLKAAPAMDALALYYMTLVRRAQGLPATSTGVTPIPGSAYGTQNYAVDMHYYGPSNVQGAFSLPEAKFDIDRFEIQNELFTNSLTLHVHNAQAAAGKHSATVQFKFNARFTPKYDELNLKHLQSMALYMQGEDTPFMPANIKENLKSWKPEDITKAVADLYPSLSAMGDISAEGDMTLETDASLQNGTLKVGQLTFRTAANGLSATTNVDIQNRVPVTADTVVVCIGCEDALTRLTAFIKVINSYMLKLDPTQKQYATPRLMDAVHTFLDTLAKTADVHPAGSTDKDWIYHISITGPGQVTLNSKPYMQVLGDFMNEIAPYIPTPFEEKGAVDDNMPSSHFEPAPVAPAPVVAPAPAHQKP